MQRYVGTRRQPSSSTGTGSTNIFRQSFFGAKMLLQATDLTVFFGENTLCALTRQH